MGVIPKKEIGRLAEWLGNGLQNRVRRFESATDLKIKMQPVNY